jgi:carbon storage regulator
MEDPPMLVMTRRKNESIVIGDDIEIIVIEVRDDKVRLGVLVPPNLPVHRKEVYDALMRISQDSQLPRPLS